MNQLLPQHLADLRASGLSDETIRGCGFRSESDPAAIRRFLNWKSLARAKSLGPCLCLPFFSVTAEYTGYVRVKPDNPLRDGGRVRKYESPRGSCNHLYIPPLTRAVLTDAAVPLIITEGEKKAAKADQEGFRCVGITGVWNWQTKRAEKNGRKSGPRTLIPDMEDIAWKKREVIIAFDSDVIEKEEVLYAEYALYVTLKKLGAKVVAARLPTPEQRPAARIAA